MEIFFAVTMFGIGMVLDPNDFILIFKNIRVVVIDAKDGLTDKTVSYS